MLTLNAKNSVVVVKDLLTDCIGQFSVINQLYGWVLGMIKCKAIIGTKRCCSEYHCLLGGVWWFPWNTTYWALKIRHVIQATSFPECLFGGIMSMIDETGASVNEVSGKKIL